jgi:hypothetical protein
MNMNMLEANTILLKSGEIMINMRDVFKKNWRGPVRSEHILDSRDKRSDMPLSVGHNSVSGINVSKPRGKKKSDNFRSESDRRPTT